MDNSSFYVSINTNGTATIVTNYQSENPLKILVQCDKQTIAYNIKPILVIPLTFGNGRYLFSLYERVGANYVIKYCSNKKIWLKDFNAYRKVSNSFVNFNTKSNFYKKAKELETIDNIKDYLVRTFSYNYVYAILHSKDSFTTPDIEKTFSTHKGICYDLSALFAAMLRICGYSAALVIGKANNNNHAWVEIDGTIYDILKDIQHKKNKINYIAERYY